MYACKKSNSKPAIPEPDKPVPDKPIVVKDPAKQLIGLSFPGLEAIATVNEADKTVKVVFSPATDPSELVPEITISNKASCEPAKGTKLNFTLPLTFTIKAEDGLTQVYSYTPTLSVSSTKDVPTPPKYLCLYYAWPSYVNGSAGNVTNAVNVFKNYDIIVFGEWLWKSDHGDHLKTTQIIAALKAIKPAIKIYGYIDVGVKTQNLSEAILKQAIDSWQNMGVTGVFGDDFGYDWGVPRARQNVFIDYAHSKSLSVFANAWMPDDALGGPDCHLDKNDFYLLESLVYGKGAYGALNLFKQRGDRAYYYMKTKKIGVAVVGTTVEKGTSSSSGTTNPFLMSWYSTAMYNFDAFQFTDFHHSSSSDVVYWYPNPLNSYGSQWKDYDWIKKSSENTYQRSTDTHTLIITGDGSATGIGRNTQP